MEVLGPAYAQGMSEMPSDSPQLSKTGEQILKEGNVLCARQQEGLAFLITYDDRSHKRICIYCSSSICHMWDLAGAASVD